LVAHSLRTRLRSNIASILGSSSQARSKKSILLAFPTSPPRPATCRLPHPRKGAQCGLAPDWDSFFLIFQAIHPFIATRFEFASTYKPWEHSAPLVYAKVRKSD
jgi:hypothetical protein